MEQQDPPPRGLNGLWDGGPTKKKLLHGGLHDLSAWRKNAQGAERLGKQPRRVPATASFFPFKNAVKLQRRNRQAALAALDGCVGLVQQSFHDLLGSAHADHLMDLGEHCGEGVAVGIFLLGRLASLGQMPLHRLDIQPCRVVHAAVIDRGGDLFQGDVRVILRHLLGKNATVQMQGPAAFYHQATHGLLLELAKEHLHFLAVDEMRSELVFYKKRPRTINPGPLRM